MDILFIEDDEGFTELLTRQFSGKYNLTFSMNINLGLQYLKEKDYNIVFCDISLPDAFGIGEILKLLKDNDKKQTPIAFLSGIRPIKRDIDKRVVGLFCKDDLQEVSDFLEEWFCDG